VELTDLGSAANYSLLTDYLNHLLVSFNLGLAAIPSPLVFRSLLDLTVSASLLSLTTDPIGLHSQFAAIHSGHYRLASPTADLADPFSFKPACWHPLPCLSAIVRTAIIASVASADIVEPAIGS